MQKGICVLVALVMIAVAIGIAGQKDFVLVRSRSSHIAYLKTNVSVRWWKVGQDTTTTPWLADTTDTLGEYDIPDSATSGQYYIYLDGLKVETINHTRMRGDTLSFATMDPVFVLADKASGYDTLNADANGNLKTALGDTASRMIWGIKSNGTAAPCSIDASGNLKITTGGGGGSGSGRLYGTLSGTDSIPLRAVATDSSLRATVTNTLTIDSTKTRLGQQITNTVTIDSTKTRLGQQITNTVTIDSTKTRLGQQITNTVTIDSTKTRLGQQITNTVTIDSSKTRLGIHVNNLDSVGLTADGASWVQNDLQIEIATADTCSLRVTAGAVDTDSVYGLAGTEYMLHAVSAWCSTAVTPFMTIFSEGTNFSQATFQGYIAFPIFVAMGGEGGFMTYTFPCPIPILAPSNKFYFLARGVGGGTAGRAVFRFHLSRADTP
jgi:hypothetical protein